MTRLLLISSLAFALGPVTPALGQEATRDEITALARQAAAGDAGALRELRGIEAVEGRPVELGAALEGSGGDVAARLEVLAREPAAPRLDDPQGTARAILEDRRFRATDLPQPFREPLEAVADRLEDLGGWLSEVVDAIPGEGAIEWVVLAAVVAVVAVLVAIRMSRRRARVRAEDPLVDLGPHRIDPAQLERDADRAEAEGDLERALRLRFAAGLRRLDERHAISFSPSLTSGDLARLLHSSDFDRLATIFDEVVYGKRPPTDDDLTETRARWGAILTRRSSRAGR